MSRISPPVKTRTTSRGRRRRRLTSVVATLAVAGATVLQAVVATAPASAVDAPVGQGFTVTASDLSFILDQIQIAERHTRTLTASAPCSTLIGTGANQIPSPLVSKGLRTTDGSCNNLQPGQETFGAADQLFPRISSKSFRAAEDSPAAFGPPAPTSYAQKSGNVFDSQPRVVSNLIVDQTSTNPAARAAAGNPVRSQGGEAVIPCTTDPDPLADPPVLGVPAGCTPTGQTLFIPNVTTDVGLSPPYNSLFTLFGQFFDHGVDQTVKGGGTVFVPLKADDPLITVGPDHIAGTNCGDPILAKNCDEVTDPQQQFMVLTRAQNQPGEDGVLGTADDVQDAENTDSPWVDQSQTYTSHSAHQVFLREYRLEAGKPVSTGKLLGGPAEADGHTSIGTWADVKEQSASMLGLRLGDRDVTDIPMLAADPYGNFIPGPNGLPQYVTASGLVEGDLGAPVAPPADVRHFDTPFLTDIAHNADPSPQDTDHNPGTPKVAPTPDEDTTASADFANQPPGTYDDEMLDAHFSCGDGRCNENIGLSAIHQVFHSEHDRLIGVIKDKLENDTTATGVAQLAQWQAPRDTSVDAGPNAPAFDYGQRLFQAARFVTEMEYQHLVFEEFARKVQPGINPFEPFAFTQTELNPAIKAEFAHAVYRFGHSMLTDTISRRNEDGAGLDNVFGTKDDVRGSTNDISLLDGFLNPPAYFDGGPAGPLTSKEAAGSIVMGMSDQPGNELDEFVTETLRNNLLGLPLDLATVNMARARSEGIPSLNNFRKDVFAATNDGAMAPYTSWVDFGEHLKHPESLINFVAAYGKHPTITAETTVAGKREAARLIVAPEPLDDPTTIPEDSAAFMNAVPFAGGTNWETTETGLDTVDLWVGGLAEVTNVFGGLLGSTFNYVFENQLTDLQNGDRLYYLARTPGMNLRTQLEGNSFSELIMRNTNAHSLKADAFATADCKFELKNLDGTPAGFTASGNFVADDVDSECREDLLLLRKPDGTIQYRARNTVDPTGINGQSVYNGTAGVDRISGGNDSDTFWGGLGKDRIEGGDGADIALGGEGSDIITDLNGDDVPKGGPGNDAIDAGPGLDILMGGEGKDFTNGGANANETFGGDSDDFIMLGQSLDAAFGDSGDDWEEGGDQPDLMQGDSGNLFFLDDSQAPGSDILIGQGGDDDYDMEGGDDIGVGGPGIEKVAGASGYDWEIGLGDPQHTEMDLADPLVADILTVGVRDKFNEVESLSGGDQADILRGDDVVPSQVGGGGFIGCDVLDQKGLDRIDGLDALVPPLATPLADVVALSASLNCPILDGPVWGDGNILLGGAGNDLIEGRGADDIIDGDKYMNVRLSVRNDAGVEIGTAGVNQLGQSPMTSKYLRDGTGALIGKTLQEAVFAGDVDPGNIVAVREIKDPSAADAASVDTAVFSGPLANYTITTGDGHVTVTDTTGTDGVDTLTHMERLQFTDQTIAAPAPPSSPIIGTAVAGDASALVRWTAGPDTGVEATSEFKIQVITGGSVVNTVTGIAPTATSATVTGLTNGTSYTFRVIATNGVGDSTPSAPSNAVTPVNSPPSVLVANPANGSTGFAVGGNLTATFSENVVNVSNTTVLLRNTATSAGVGKAVTYDAATRTVTVNPNANLAQSTSYTLTLSGAGAGGIKDTTGLALPTTTIVFTTAGDTTAPTVTSSTPVNGAVGVSRAANQVVNFSERVQGVSDASVVLTNRATGNVLPATLTMNAAGNRLTINPAANLAANTAYDLKLLGGAALIRDVAGNPLADTTIGFTTR